MAKGVQFTRESAQRIATAVRKSEGLQSQPIRARAQHTGAQEVFGFAFENISGQAVPPYACMHITGSTVVPGVQGLALEATQSSAYGAQYKHVFNAGVEVANGAVGTCYAPCRSGYFAGGYTMAVYDSADGTPVYGEKWGPRSGTWKLKKNTGGFMIVGVIDGTNHVALVWHEPMLVVRGVPTGTISAGASGTITIYTGPAGSESSTSVTMSTVYNNSSCTIQTQLATAMWIPDNGVWQFVVARTS